MGLIGHGRGDDAAEAAQAAQLANAKHPQFGYKALERLGQAIAGAQERLSQVDSYERNVAINKVLSQPQYLDPLIAALDKLRLEPARIVGLDTTTEDDE